MNLGKLIIEALTFIGKRTGCYKIILDCSDKNVPFYQKCGFTQKVSFQSSHVTLGSGNGHVSPRKRKKNGQTLIKIHRITSGTMNKSINMTCSVRDNCNNQGSSLVIKIRGITSGP
jgi:hypothetical protein